MRKGEIQKGLAITQKFNVPIVLEGPNNELIRIVCVRTVGEAYRIVIDAPKEFKINRDPSKQPKMHPIHIGHEPQTGIYDH